MKTLPRSTRQGYAERSTDAQGEGLGGPSRTALFADKCQLQTFIVFMPVSASVLVLKMPLSTTVVVVVVVGFLSTIVHFLVVASRTT